MKAINNGVTRYYPFQQNAFVHKKSITRIIGSEPQFEEYRFAIVESEKTDKEGNPYKNILLSAYNNDHRVATIALLNNMIYIWDTIDKLLENKSQTQTNKSQETRNTTRKQRKKTTKIEDQPF